VPHLYSRRKVLTSALASTVVVVGTPIAHGREQGAAPRKQTPAASASAPGQPVATVQLDVRADDQTMVYIVTKAAMETIRASTRHSLTTSGSADITLRIAIATARKSASDAEPIGLAIAYVVTRKAPNGAKDVTNLANTFSPRSGADASVRTEVARLLAQ
jgi:hypothetical protein